MRILFLTSTHNELSQRAFAELVEQGHTVAVQTASSDTTIEAAVTYFRPELIVAAFLNKELPASIAQKHTVLKVRPANVSDRGASSRFGKVTESWQNWRITVTQAATTTSSGGEWASQTFSMPVEEKSDYYRHHFTQAAVQSILKAIEKLERKAFTPKPLITNQSPLRGRLHNTLLLGQS